MNRFILLLLMLALAVPAFAQELPNEQPQLQPVPRTEEEPPPPPPAETYPAASIFKFYLGANAVSFDGHQFPSDFELGGTARASLTPHLSGVGSLFYGLNYAYLTAAVGGRITVSDVDNPDFSIGIGMQYHASSQPDVRPEEWAPDATIGWVPWPEKLPKWTFGASGGYGLETHTAFGLLAVRYALGY